MIVDEVFYLQVYQLVSATEPWQWVQCQVVFPLSLISILIRFSIYH